MAAIFRRDTSIPFKRVTAINLGGVSVRFLSVNEETRTALFPADPNNCEGTLLFLASDVLTGTSILKKNFIRVHGRFSKLGVASKMNLKGFKIDGINNSGVIWFYSIKGLFRVAFELGSEPFQKDCLTLLQSEWLNRFNEPNLLQDQTIHLPPIEVSDCSFQGQSSSENVRETITVYVYDENTVVKIENEENDSDKDEQEALDKESVNKLGNTQSYDYTANAHESFTENESTNTEEQTNAFRADILDQSIHLDEMESENLTGGSLSVRNQDTCNDCNEGGINEVNTEDESQSKEVYDDFESETEMWKSLTAEVFLQKLDVFLKDCVCMSSDVSLQCVTSNLLVTVNFLQNLLRTSQGQLYEDGLIVFQLINKYSYLVSTDQKDESTIDTFGISRLKFLLLFVLSEWLGKEFNNLETMISQKVELFKKQNIQNIDNLPSAEETIDFLFPAFMKVLISSWLGENHEACSSDIDLSEHDYCEQRTKVDSHRYLLVQLILEFVTNSLISGITHVVIAKLKSQSLL